MAIGLDLDMTGGALQIVGGKDLAIIGDTDGIAQRVTTRLDMHAGEWFLDVDAGVDWLGSVLGKGHTDAEIKALVRSKISSVPGVSAVTQLTIKRDPASRTAVLVWTATADTGALLTGTKGIA